MTETVVHVTTLEQWKAVLDVWFEHGYKWYSEDKEYQVEYFKAGSRELLLDKDNDILIPTPVKREPISYKEFMAQQKEDKEMETYYVTQEQLDLIKLAKGLNYPLTGITAPENLQKEFDKTNFDNQKEILRYLGGDETIEFKVKEQLYWLTRIDDLGKIVYMYFEEDTNTPYYTGVPAFAFTAPLEEIKKWQTPAWKIEEVSNEAD